MAMMKSIGDKESPFLTPLRCLILGPWVPLRMIREVAVESRVDIHLRQFGPNPLACRTSSKNGQDRVSNAFDMSSFRSIIGIFFFWIKTMLAECT